MGNSADIHVPAALTPQTYPRYKSTLEAVYFVEKRKISSSYWAANPDRPARSPVAYRLLPTATDCYRLLPTATDCYRLLPNATDYYRLLPTATNCYRLLPNATDCYRLLPASLTYVSYKVNFFLCFTDGAS